jgi:SNF2 family DNA or RNA helicase
MGHIHFQVGDRVSKRSNPNKKGEIRKVTVIGSEVIYIVQYDDGTNGTLESAEVIGELREQDPFSLLKSDMFHDSKIFRISNTIFKISNNLSNTISALKASRTLFLPYQYKPLIKFLQSDYKRILVADEVGLGKTIEAGHIILEMLIRDSLSNCLIIAKKALLPKWQDELKSKFNVDFKLYDNSKELVRDITSDGISNKRTVRGIVNYEKIITQGFLQAIQDYGYGFDLVIMDEAQHIRNQSSQRYKATKALLRNSDNVVMLTATPVMTHINNLHSLIRLLDDTYEDKHLFNQAIEFNKPFVRALNSVNQKLNFDQIRKELVEAEIFVGRTFKEEKVGDMVSIGAYMNDDPLFIRLLEVLNGAWRPDKASDAQKYLQHFNLFHSLYTRTRKKDVQDEKDPSKGNY